MKNEKRLSNGRRKFREIIDNANIMDYLVFICITSINIFVIVSLYFYYKHGIPVSDIQGYFFTFFGTELIAMATISISSNIAEAQKNRREKKREELDDEL